ncbi:MAG: selenoprotein B, partial [Burkholderiales bacterium]|nr:selenoprotein B [Burkholderiales bacterium]
MSALAHAVEARGLPTTVVALIKEHAMAVRPPRALAVPFMLGRPFGAPDSPALQREVLVAALGLLERTDGPVILETFPGGDPGGLDRAGWQPAVALPAPVDTDSAQQWASLLQAELDRILPVWAQARARTGRT